MPVKAVDLGQVSSHVLGRRVRLLFRKREIPETFTALTHTRAAQRGSWGKVSSAHSFVPNPDVSIVAGRQQVLVLPVPLHLRRPGWRHEAETNTNRCENTADFLVCTLTKSKTLKLIHS